MSAEPDFAVLTEAPKRKLKDMMWHSDRCGSKVGKVWAYVIGLGLALFPIHNLWLTNLATNSKGETLFFLPAFGCLLLIMGTGLFLLNNWNKVRDIGWGDRRIVGCLLFIVLAIALSGANFSGWEDRLAPLGAGLSLFAVYLASRVLGKDVFLPIAIGAGVASVGIIVHGLSYPGLATGGFVFEQNIDIATGYILLGTALFVHRWQWLLAGLAVVSLFISGAPEAMFAMGVLGLVVLVRRDWSRKLIVSLTPAVTAIIIIFMLGYGSTLFQYVIQSTTGQPTVPPVPSMGTAESLSPLAWRWHVIQLAASNLSPLGDGYNLTGFTTYTVHNVPLIIVQQLGWPGALAGLAWLWISVWCLMKTKWKYAWSLVLSLSVFDHYLWSQLAPLWWMLAGVSTTSTIKSDLVFKEHVK